ncbi:DUF5017 domain-containing protein [Echinicola vietnamensis]|uniref:DUF5017 domain-containing protein n=1 Tax=Echinicola vietnamensis (strain DSM 17526 / LMG 23754 / KMM 6221) TaxID=926556 RepID=L0FRY1_ECHVK|nr:DUF5017 domain-containing protein [Echinicola vietnamensis]AGA76694.1 hypothetical protein Echvi_0406 [Echinicola vietnamensis DSM 17526]
MKFVYLIVPLISILSSCESLIEVDTPDFDVMLEKGLTYNVGDTVKFAFTGYAGNITFYSGLPGSDYEFRERKEIDGGVPQIELVTQYGGGGTQINSLRLMVTTDLMSMDSAGVVNANWTDISDKADIAPNTTITPSGVLDLSEYVESGKPLFFGFKFVGETSATHLPGNWIIHDFVANTVMDDGSALPVVTMPTASWSTFSILNDASKWIFRNNNTQAYIIGGGYNAPPSEDWMITKGLNFTKVPPDTGLPIQNIGSNALKGYEFVYNTPGTYTVTFIGSNYTVDDHKEVIRQFTIAVEEE